MKSNVVAIAKSLEKLFNAGFTDDKSIQKLKIEDIEKISDVNMQDLFTIIKFKKALRTKQMLNFLTGNEEIETEVDE